MTKLYLHQIPASDTPGDFLVTLEDGMVAWASFDSTPAASQVGTGGEQIVQDGATPPVSLTNEAGDDWLYQG